MPLYTPYDPRTPPCPRGEGRSCRITCTLSAARRRGPRRASSRASPGRYARLLRRSRVVGIASAPRLAGLLRTFPARALSGREYFSWMARNPRCGGCLLTGSLFLLFFAVWRCRVGRDGFPAIWDLPTIGEHNSFFQGTVFSDPLHRICRGKAVFSDLHQRLASRFRESMKSLPY